MLYRMSWQCLPWQHMKLSVYCEPMRMLQPSGYLNTCWLRLHIYCIDMQVPILAGLGRNKTDVPMPEWYKVEDEPEAFALDKSPGEKLACVTITCDVKMMCR
jgi:hypothetical protein